VSLVFPFSEPVRINVTASAARHAQIDLEFIGVNIICTALGIAVPAYVSLFKTRRALQWMRKTASPPVWMLITLGDVLVSLYIAALGLSLGYRLAQTLHPTPLPVQVRRLIATSLSQPFDMIAVMFSFAAIYFPLVAPAFIACIWLWLYMAAGTTLKAAQHLDAGYRRINRVLDLENKPLQALGLVGGSLFTFAYSSFLLASTAVRTVHAP
jgi:hypothetical protein